MNSEKKKRIQKPTRFQVMDTNIKLCKRKNATKKNKTMEMSIANQLKLLKKKQVCCEEVKLL